jgi:simple sugar transport system permease protein
MTLSDVAFGTFITSVCTGAIQSGTPVGFAAIGETICERTGVINLGLEGIMLIGALTGVIVQVEMGNTVLALCAAGLAAMLLSGVHALMVVGLNSNQIVSGIAVSIVGTGISSFFGRAYVGLQFDGIPKQGIPGLRNIPFFGQVFFQQDILVYLTLLTAIAVWFFLYRTRLGLQMRAIGEDPKIAYEQGVQVRRARILAILVGGFLAGIGGAYLSLAYTQVWAERMTSGQGIIAVGLVIAAGWRPVRALLAAYVFGALTVLHPNLQAFGSTASPYLVKMLPYLVTLLALVLSTLKYAKRGQGLPAALMRQFLLGGGES